MFYTLCLRFRSSQITKLVTTDAKEPSNAWTGIVKKADFAWKNAGMPEMESDGIKTIIKLSTINPHQFKEFISQIKLFINIPQNSKWKGVQIEYQSTYTISDDDKTIEWDIKYTNPSLPGRLSSGFVDLYLFVVAFQKSKDRRKWTSDGKGRYDDPIYRTPTYSVKVCRKNCRITNNVEVVVNAVGAIPDKIPNATMNSLSEVIKWNHWDDELSNDSYLLTMITISDDVLVSLINSKNMIADRFIVYHFNGLEWTKIKEFLNGIDTITITQVEVPTLFVDRTQDILLKVVGFQTTNGDIVACSKAVNVGHAFDGISQNHDFKRTDHDFGKLQEFKWNKAGFKKHKGTFEIKLDLTKTLIASLKEKYPNLHFWLSYQENGIWIFSTTSLHMRMDSWSWIGYNQVEQAWTYTPNKKINTNVRIFAYDPDGQTFVGCTATWDLTSGVNGIKTFPNRKSKLRNLPIHEDYSHDTIGTEFDDEVSSNYLPKAYYLDTPEYDSSKYDADNVPLAPSKDSGRLSLRTVALIIVAAALLLLAIVFGTIMLRKKLKLIKQIRETNEAQSDQDELSMNELSACSDETDLV